MPGKILLGITGSIAAFKAAQLASDLVKAGCEVRAVFSEGAHHFVAPLTFEAITGHPVAAEVWDEQPGSSRMGHLELARWADVLVIAPATADVLARVALGIADDMLTTVALASRCPLIIAPAMETAMWEHPATRQNVATLQSRRAIVVGPETGHLASGTIGSGRMSEPAQIKACIDDTLQHHQDLLDLRVLVTAGPTYEAIDPIRFIGNHSSGKMGYAVAEEARGRGADVTLISGPTALLAPPGVDLVRVTSQAEMRDAVLKSAPSQDVIVMAAAVADFRPTERAEEKMKRTAGLSLQLEPTEDIAAEASRLAPKAIHVGFALETSDLIERAREKMARKGQRLVVANAFSADHNPLGSGTNQVSFVTEDEVTELPETSKREVARRLWDRIAAMRRTA